MRLLSLSPLSTRCRPRLAHLHPARCSPARAPARAPARYMSTASKASAPTSTPPPSSTPPPASTPDVLAPFADDLDALAPRVDITADQVRVLATPAEFYATLKAMIRGARRRVFLSTLYIGTDEHELVATLHAALAANDELHVHILTDALRGTREAPNACSASLLAPLVADFPGRVDIRMYHTPNLTGLRKRLAPARINEGWGLQHMKLYGADDTVLITGANLSRDYFTNRQDRYHVFASPALATRYWRFHEAVATLSFRVEPSSSSSSGFELVWPTDNAAPSPLDAPVQFVNAATAALMPVVQPASKPTTTPRQTDTSVYVLAQMAQLLPPGTSTERPAVARVLARLADATYARSRWTFTAGYFNPDPALAQQLLATSCARGNTVITAAPQANGFFGSAGVSGLLPDAYTFLAHRFLRRVVAQKRGDSITLYEWAHGRVGQPGGWTYHAKGLWVDLPGAAMTLVGSSNYTQRSYALDLEANALVLTTNAGLRQRLHDEQTALQAHAAPVSLETFQAPDRRVRFHVRLAMWLVKLLGGQL